MSHAKRESRQPQSMPIQPQLQGRGASCIKTFSDSRPWLFFLAELPNPSADKCDEKEWDEPVMQQQQLLFFLKSSITAEAPRKADGPSTLRYGSVGTRGCVMPDESETPEEYS